jgi:cytochrome c553
MRIGKMNAIHRAQRSIRRAAFRTTLTLFGMLTVSSLVNAADADAGKAIAARSCNICHGVRGLSTMPVAPNLAGQISMYTEEQLRQYRSGKRANEVMGVIAKPLTDKEIEDLAAWYASIKIEVKSD